ncbi:MAG: carboxypeptidase regulatory-like domain-containing protein [Sarcina sp.]
MADSITLVILGKDLKVSPNLNFNFEEKTESYILVKGEVLSPEKIPLKNAAITITMIENINNELIKSFLGVTFTDENGEYGTSLFFKTGVSYEFKAYCAVG